MLVGLELLRFQGGHGSMSEVVIELMDSAADDALALGPRGALSQDSFAHAPDEKWAEQRLIAAVKQQIAVELSIGGQRLVENKLQGGRRLVRIPKGGRLLALLRQAL